MINWPTTLPPLPLSDSYSGTSQSGVVSDGDYNGKKNRRRRFTATSKYHSVKMVMTKVQYLIFLDFFNISIGRGALPFTFVNPIFQLGNINCRIQAKDPPYTVEYDGDTLDYLVSFIIEELPGTITSINFNEYKITSEEEYIVTSVDENKITDR